VAVLFGNTTGPLYDDFRDCSRVVDLRNPFMKLHRRERYAPLDRRRIRRYLERARPRSVLSAKSVSNYCVARAKKELDFPGKVVISEHIDAEAGRRALSPVQRVVVSRLTSFYRYADAVVGVSKGVTDGLLGLGIPPDKVHTIYDPTVTNEMLRLAREQPPHPWLNPKHGRVILGTGRFTPQKDFENLIRAFGIVAATRPDCRLIIVGEGPDRDDLERLIAELALEGKVDLPGYARNPYSYMSRADLYVLSSRYEGLAMTLVEAMALGTPVVSTDCPSGPAEVLDHGRYGSLVPIEDPSALAKAMADALAHPGPVDGQVEWAKKTFSVETAGEKYLSLLLPDTTGQPASGDGNA
jgi:glycosyltransferase involved in cell wall biosynthesis